MPDKRAGNLSNLNFPPLDLRGWETDLARLSPDDRAKFVEALEQRVNALRTIRDMRSLGEDKVKEADAANEASIKRRDEQLADLFRANPTLKGLFERMERTLEQQIATELPRREQGTAIGTARLIRACLEGMPPDTATVFEILRSSDQARLAEIRESFRSTMQGSQPVEKQIEMYLDGIQGLTEQDRELLLRLFGGKLADFEGTSLVATLQSRPPSNDPAVAAQWRMVLRGEVSMQLGENAEEIDRRIGAFNRMTSRRELFERWLASDPAKLKEFKDWEAAFTGDPNKKSVLFDRWIRRGGLSADKAAEFEAYVEANISKEPNHFARTVEAQFGAGTQYMAWIDAKKAGNTKLADSILLVESVQLEKASSRDVLMYLMRMSREDRAALAEAYYQKYGTGNPAYASDHSKCLFDAIVARKDTTQPDQWTEATRRVLGAYLSGQQIDQKQLEVDLGVSALGFRSGMREGEIARPNLVDFNFLLEGKDAAQRQEYIRAVEAQIGRGLTTPDGQARIFNIDPNRPGAALEAYMARYSEKEPETVTVLTVRQNYLDEIRRLSNRVNNQGLSEGDRRGAAAELDTLNKNLEAERLRFKRAEEQLRRGEIAAMPADLAGNLTYFDKNSLTTIDRRAQYTAMVRTLISDGPQDERRVQQAVLRVEGGDPRSRQLMEYARMLDGDVSHSLMNIRGTTSNLIRSWSSYDRDFRVSVSNHICGLFAYCSGATDEAERMIRREEGDVQRRMAIFVETQERTKKALAGMATQSRAYQALEIQGNIAELKGDYVSAQQQYNQAQLAYKKAEEEILQAHNKSVEERVIQNRKMIRELAESNERLAKVDQTLAGYQDAIVKTGVIVGATAVTICTAGAGAPFLVGVVAGTSAGAGLSLGFRSYQYGVQGKGNQIGGQEFWGKVGDDTFDAFVASVGARGASGITQSRTAVATTRAQIVRAHVQGNMFAAGTMFTGNTGKNVVAVYGDPFGLSEGAMAKAEKKAGRPLTEAERTKVLEEHRLTAGQLTRDGFTYFVTAWAGGKISGHTQALGGSFQQVAPGVTRHVAYDPGLWTRTLGTANFVGQTGVAFGGNGLNYAYYRAGLEKEFHFDAGLLVAPAGNISFGGPSKGPRRTGAPHEGPVPTGGGGGHADPHAPGGTAPHPSGTAPHPSGTVPEPVTPSSRRRAELHGEAARIDTEAGRHPAGSREAANAHAEAAKKRAEAGRLQVDDAHAALTDAKSNGTRAQVTEAEAGLHRAQRAGLELEQIALDKRKAATVDPVEQANLAKEQAGLDKRRAAHAEDVLSTHRQAHNEPLGNELLVRKQLEVEAAQARLRAHDSENPTPTSTDNAKRARLETELARAQVEQHKVANPTDQTTLRTLENAEAAARDRQIKATERAHADRVLAGETIPPKELAALERLKVDHAATESGTALRRHIEDHGAATPADAAQRAERGRLVGEDLAARKAQIELREAQAGKKASAAEKSEIEIAKKTLERDQLRAELEGHVPATGTKEQLQRKLFNAEEQLIRARERQVVEEQRQLDNSRSKGEAVDPLKQARTTEKAAQIESDRAKLALDRAEAALKQHVDEKGPTPAGPDAATRARLESEVQQRRMIREHEQKAADAAKAKREAVELEHTPGADPAAVRAAQERARVAVEAEVASRAQAEAAHKKLIDDAKVRLEEAKRASDADKGNASLEKARNRAETDVLRLESDAARCVAEGRARELQRHCIDHPQLNDHATINRRFELEAEARDARKKQFEAERDFAGAQDRDGVKGAKKRQEEAQRKIDALEAESRTEPARRRTREDELAARKSVTDAEAVAETRRIEAENADAAHKRYLADNPDWAADPAKRQRAFELEDTAIRAREAHEDAARNHRLAQMNEELATATGARKNELERAIARAEAEGREVHAKRAEAELERFGRRNDAELADPMLDSKRREELRTERRRLEDQANQQRADYLEREIALTRRELSELPPTLDAHERHQALKRKLDSLELRQAENAAQKAERELRRHQTDMLEQEAGDPGLKRKAKEMSDVDWQERHRLVDAELKARQELLERQLADARAKHADDPNHPAVQKLAAELAEARAASANMGTPDKPGKYFAAEQARHAFEVSKGPVERAQAAYDALVAKHGFDPSTWSPDATRQIRQAYKVLEREIGRTGINGRRKQVDALEKQLAWETERDKAIRRELGLKDTDPIPETSRRGWGEDRRRPVGRNTEGALEEARTRLRQEESERWNSAGKWAKRGLGLALAGFFLKDLFNMKDQLGNLWDGLDFYENDNGYMYGRSDDGGPIDEMMYTKLANAKPEEYLGIAREHLRLAYGSILSDDDIEKFAKRIVASGNGGVPSQMAIRDIVTEADSLAADASNIQRMLIERTSRPAPPSTPTHGVGGFYDLERLRVEDAIPRGGNSGLQLPPRP